VSPTGESDLNRLISAMRPSLHAPTYVFVTVDPAFDATPLKPILQFHEAEGLSLIVEEEAAAGAGLQSEFPSKMITLNIHSALEAVGFLARITTHLAALDMGVNPISAFYHDHLFVPADRADDAMQALHELSQSVDSLGESP